jgi:hypothetical protein
LDRNQFFTPLRLELYQSIQFAGHTTVAAIGSDGIQMVKDIFTVQHRKIFSL